MAIAIYPKFKEQLLMANGEIDAVQLGDRHAEFLREVRHAMSHDDAITRIGDAQRSYAKWFADRGVKLIFPDGFEDARNNA